MVKSYTNFLMQKSAEQGRSEFFFIVNIQVCVNLKYFSVPQLIIIYAHTIHQVPGSTTYSLALYYMMNTRLEDSPLLESFVKGDDAFRNSRFKLIPYISKVGTRNIKGFIRAFISSIC